MSNNSSEAEIDNQKDILKELFITMATKVSEQLDFLLKDKSDMESRKQLEECFIDIFKMYREHTVKH